MRSGRVSDRRHQKHCDFEGCLGYGYLRFARGQRRGVGNHQERQGGPDVVQLEWLYQYQELRHKLNLTNAAQYATQVTEAYHNDGLAVPATYETYLYNTLNTNEMDTGWQ